MPESPSLEKGPYKGDSRATHIGSRNKPRGFRRLFNILEPYGLLLLTLASTRYIFGYSAHETFCLQALQRLLHLNPAIDPAFLDVTRSRPHKAVFVPSIQFELNILNTTGVFAEWYDDPQVGGESPFDYQIPPEWQLPLKDRKTWSIALPDGVVCPDQAHEEACDLMKALNSSPARHTKTISQSQVSRASSGALISLDTPSTYPEVYWAHRSFGKAKHKIQILPECMGRNCTNNVFLQDGQVTLARHAFELVEFFEHWKLQHFHGRNFPMHLFAHLPYAADPARYFPLFKWEDKRQDLLDVDGVLLSDKTKERQALLPEQYRQARLCLFTSTAKKRMSRDWVKAMLSGCIIVSDMPTESEEVLEHTIFQYPAGADRRTIQRVINNALTDENELKRRALHVFIYARQHFTPAKQVGRILQLTEQYRSGERGYDFPMPFSATCREYPDGSVPTWC